MNNTTKENIHKRHRQNMREVYYNSGLDSLPDHTVLELLLYFGIPRKDTNELAHQLINKFGSFSAVLCADRKALAEVPGMTENAACLVSMLLPIYRRYCDDLKEKNIPVCDSETAYNFVSSYFICNQTELSVAVFLDSSHKAITSRVICEGNVSNAIFDLRELVSSALETKARYIILCHNHPSGVLMPSLDDVEITKNICAYMKALGVDVTDHLIVDSNSYISMADMKKYKDIFNG